MKRILITVALLLSISACAAAQGNKTPMDLLDVSLFADRFYHNPSALDGIGDPFIVKEGSAYYCFATKGGAGFFTWRTHSLADWGSARRIVAFQGTDWAAANYWAPEVCRYDEHYVLVYSAQRGAAYDLRLGIAVSDHVAGAYTDPLGGPLADQGYGMIDASLFIDDEGTSFLVSSDGTPYLFYVHDNYDHLIDGHHVSQIYGVQLSGDLLSTVGEPVLLATPDVGWEMQSGHTLWNEGVNVIKHNRKYYMFYSANCTASKDYAVGVAVSDSPLGPYVKQANNPLLQYALDPETGAVIVSGPGHNSFFTVGNELFSAYHINTSNENPTTDRVLCFDRAGFHADGTAYINGVSLDRQLLPLADLGLVNAAQTASASSNGDTGLLTDGDYCISRASGDYFWYGTNARLTWETPIVSDMIILYAKRKDVTGSVIINGTYEIPVDFSGTGNLPGASTILCFDPMEITSVRLQLDRNIELGEIIVLAEP